MLCHFCAVGLCNSPTDVVLRNICSLFCNFSTIGRLNIYVFPMHRNFVVCLRICMSCFNPLVLFGFQALVFFWGFEHFMLLCLKTILFLLFFAIIMLVCSATFELFRKLHAVPCSFNCVVLWSIYGSAMLCDLYFLLFSVAFMLCFAVFCYL